MNKYKKLGFGLGLLMVFGGFIFIGPKALAFTQTDFQKATYTIVSQATITVLINGQTYTFTDDNVADNIYNWKPTAGAKGTPCMANTNNGRGDGVNYTSDLINPPGAKGGNVVNVGEVLGVGPRGPNCGNLVSVNGITLLNPNNVGFGGTPGGGGGATGTDDACYSQGWELSWIACPVITAAQTAANAMYGFVEDQLKFTVQQNCTKDSGCNDSLGADYKSVHSAWSNFRILASSLVVILLLVMVISQAIGAGPFDAYTVRKMLPRLVAGVILIQISWPLFSWIVNTVDHLGVGLADIMYAPFGGSKALDLNTIMEPFTNSVGGTAKVVAFNYASIGALAVLGVAAPFVILGMILTVLVAIFVGFLTLLFRKILIILALIFVPVALIAWMMPNDGLRRYWKLWWDNFIKALMMFPLIIAMIAGGRIFAKIGSGQSDFVGFFIVLVGFFGPLFILPKTFKWGGTLMQSAGQSIASAGQKGLKKPMEGLKGMNERYQGKRASMLEYNRTGKRAALTRGLRRAQSGHMIPYNKRSRKLAIQAGDKWSGEENEIAATFSNRAYNKALTDGYTDKKGKTYKPGVQAAKVALSELARHKDERIAKGAIKQLVVTSSWPEIQSFEDEQGRKVFEDNDVWNQTAAQDPDIYRAVLKSRTDAASHIIENANEETAKAKTAGRTFASPREELDFKSSKRIHYSIAKQMSNEDFSGESDGFWGEAARVSQLKDAATGDFTVEAKEVRTALRTRFESIRDIGGTAPQQLLGHLASGGTLQDNVETILGGKGTLLTYVNPRTGGSAPAPVGLASGRIRTPSGRTYETGNVEGGQRTASVSRENIQNMSEKNAANWVQEAGGYGNMSNQDLVTLYNVRRDAVQQTAREELQKRGMFNPSGPNLPVDIEPPPAASTPPTPSGGGTEGRLDIPHDTPPEDFGPGGRLPPPDIPPGSGNV